MLQYGYISNGFMGHSLAQMVTVLKHFGYRGIGITLDHLHLHPFRASAARLAAIRRLLENAPLTPVVETGAQYILDPFRKHRPSLVSTGLDGRGLRIRYYRRAIEVAAQIGAKVVSLWSGTPQRGVPPELSWERLTTSLAEVCDHAARNQVVIGFEPEPGMFVGDLAGFEELHRRLPHEALGLTLDLGHVAITEEPPLTASIERFAKLLVNVHIDDVRDRRHEHLPLGLGEIDFPPLLATLRKVRYRGLVLVELSRNSHEAPLQAGRSLRVLQRAEGRGTTLDGHA